jgi:hypothetical protein
VSELFLSIRLMKQKTVLKKKKKSESKTSQKSESKQKLSSKQKVALHAVQKQMQLLKLKQWLVVIGFAFGGAALRGPMQAVPSAEPITFFAILSGWLFGKKKGFVTGAAAGYISNFIMFGGHGPWTIPQMLVWGLAGFLGGFIKNIKPTKNYFVYWLRSIIPVVGIVFVSTLLFDIVMNVSWAFFSPFSIIGLMLSGLPFLLIHLTSNIGFSLLLPFARKVVHEKGKFNEMEICKSIVNKFGGSAKLNWMSKRDR